MRTGNQSKWRIINWVSIVTAVLCVLITFWGNWKNNGVLTIDAFMGIIATLIGVCTTIIVGLQILNYIEFRDAKNKIQELEDINSKIHGTNYLHETILRESNTQLSNVFVQLSKQLDSSEDKIKMYISSITLTGIGNPNYRATICADDHDTSVLESRYQYVQDLLLKIEANNMIAKLESREIIKIQRPPLWDQFKEISYKKTLKNYNKICALHFDVLKRIEELSEIK